ncbi:MAG: type IV pilin protein [Desulfotomaculales bacterium]
MLALRERLNVLRDRRGFTMVEMMVVLIIIAVLIGVGIKFYLGYMTKSKVAKATGDLTTIQAGLESYYASNGKYPAETELAAAGLPTDVIGATTDNKTYVYAVNVTNTAYVISTRVKIDGTNHVYAKGEDGRVVAPPSLVETVPTP